MNIKKLFFLLILSAFFSGKLVALPKEVNKARVVQIEQMLSENPHGIGITYKDRVFWDKFQTDKDFKILISEIPLLLSEGMPPFVDSLYIAFAKNGLSSGVDMTDARFQYLYKLVMAECIENKNKYTSEIEKAIIALTRQNAWTIPPDDSNLTTFYGTNYIVDLTVATLGNGMAQCLYMLDDKISPQVKQIALDGLNTKLFNPIRKCIENDKLFPWFTWTLNWNSVCLNGIVGAATALLNKSERAFFIAVAEQYHTYGIDGYNDDGYCSEGVSYYNYGFRALIALRETVCRATSGQIDFLETPKFYDIAKYASRIKIINDICPLYSDATFGSKPSWIIENYCENAMALKPYHEEFTFPDWHNFSMNLIWFFPNQAYPLKEISTHKTDNPIRSYFDKSGVYIGRPFPKTNCKIGVSVKGGNNAENHNHNDVGSYALVVEKELMSGDQGRINYYPKGYFGDSCYLKFKTKSSYGHPVPVINGIYQHAGTDAKGVVEKTTFNNSKDIYILDLTSAYAVNTLKILQRIYVYNRMGTGSFVVEDKFSFSDPGTFETPIITRANLVKKSRNSFNLILGQEVITVKIEASCSYQIIEEKISEYGVNYNRFVIRLNDKHKNGYVKVKYSL